MSFRCLSSCVCPSTDTVQLTPLVLSCDKHACPSDRELRSTEKHLPGGWGRKARARSDGDVKLAIFDSVRPFALSRWVFQGDRLASRVYQILFFASALMVLAMIPFFLGRVDPARMSFWPRLPWGLLGVFGPIGLFFLWIGMWCYWVKLDHSFVWLKRGWFLVLLFGFWYGSVLYFFFAYLPQVNRRLRADRT